MTARDRMRRYRDRQRRNRIVLPPLEIPSRLVEDLIDVGLLPEQLADDRAKIAEVVTKLLSTMRPENKSYGVTHRAGRRC